ncbi:NAD(P)/FAD-dependent oxidoreductase [Rubrobacter marinus]|uniref:NAD(P)/FAD-dependent oxidoreductase n=1 Tax=Rubrobacter marinus TaxID=2653852 RepID=A0A6G8PXS6_9ACTN|nr:FAD-dependent oxidoreductase [Rubrobacter marinus]QIN78990.1 NAD(P)/FAD-dependent oxidoreductase [Rubrobacter marinus]
MNETDRIVIVGGGPGGLAAARAYRESGGRGRVTILTAESFPPYRRPPLTKEYLRGEVERAELPMQGAGWYEENGVELRLATSALSLDAGRGVVATETGEIPYDACVLATGSEPLRIPVPGGDLPEVLVMRTLEDSEKLGARVSPGSRAVVVGSGFIGCEAAASLSMLGARVTLVSQEDSPQAARLGPAVARRIRGWLEGFGVDLRLGRNVEGIERSDGGLRVGVEGEETLETETVLFGTGIRPRIGLAEEAGLEIEGGGVVTDSSMRTSVPNVFAVGDVAYAMNESAGTHQKVEHWGDALNHGGVAGAVLAGGEAGWSMAPGFWSTMADKSLKYWSWSNGWDEARFVDHVEAGDAPEGAGESFTVWYGKGGTCIGVLSHNHDEDYDEGRGLVERGAPLPG